MRLPSVVLETPENPLGYVLPRLELDENSDWTPQLCEYEDCSYMNDIVKRFIRQVRESRGYDVDCIPPWWFASPFYPIPSFTRSETKRAAEFVVQKLNADAPPDKSYKLVRIKKVITTFCFKYLLLTFTVKEVAGTDDSDNSNDDSEDNDCDLYDGDGEGDEDEDEDIITYQATVDLEGKEGYELKEVRVKVPVPDATAA